jgi:hypothetical protein
MTEVSQDRGQSRQQTRPKERAGTDLDAVARPTTPRPMTAVATSPKEPLRPSSARKRRAINDALVEVGTLERIVDVEGHLRAAEEQGGLELDRMSQPTRAPRNVRRWGPISARSAPRFAQCKLVFAIRLPIIPVLLRFRGSTNLIHVPARGTNLAACVKVVGLVGGGFALRRDDIEGPWSELWRSMHEGPYPSTAGGAGDRGSHCP